MKKLVSIGSLVLAASCGTGNVKESSPNYYSSVFGCTNQVKTPDGMFIASVRAKSSDGRYADPSTVRLTLERDGQFVVAGKYGKLIYQSNGNQQFVVENNGYKMRFILSASASTATFGFTVMFDGKEYRADAPVVVNQSNCVAR